ncbi:hypothetical protein [Brunnivagina elsteri]|uniref:Uncharacterized protein n=1 Tax=Brunnivagina elsteri CCALA 953 TaxID=987040 RepID=A0A2A2TF68_9CYAN|nr:hypothetical protein [Calothrix elsteri]PAX52059.1 hypothetical protein CK510_21370 [Calothrix elsteri CCALA 953]
MKTSQRQTDLKVVPFRGEMYQDEPVTTVAAKSNSSFILLTCLCLIGVGIALGATVTYNSTEQEQLRNMQQQLQQFDKVKKQLCTVGV